MGAVLDKLVRPEQMIILIEEALTASPSRAFEELVTSSWRFFLARSGFYDKPARSPEMDLMLFCGLVLLEVYPSYRNFIRKSQQDRLRETGEKEKIYAWMFFVLPFALSMDQRADFNSMRENIERLSVGRANVNVFESDYYPPEVRGFFLNSPQKDWIKIGLDLFYRGVHQPPIEIPPLLPRAIQIFNEVEEAFFKLLGEALRKAGRFDEYLKYFDERRREAQVWIGVWAGLDAAPFTFERSSAPAGSSGTGPSASHEGGGRGAREEENPAAQALLSLEIEKNSRAGVVSHVYRGMRDLLGKIESKIENGLIYTGFEINLLKGSDSNRPRGDAKKPNRPARVGVIGLTANPPTYRHAIAALLAMSDLNLDMVVWLPHGRIEHKPVHDTENVPVEERHRMVLEMIGLFGGLFRYTDVAKGNADVSEKNLHELLRMNADEAIELYFISGSDDEEYVKKVAGNLCFYMDPANGGSQTLVGSHPIHQLKWLVVQRGSLGRDFHKPELDRLIADRLEESLRSAKLTRDSAERFKASVETAVVDNPGFFDMGSTDAREGLTGLVPASVLRLIQEKSYYGFSLPASGGTRSARDRAEAEVLVRKINRAALQLRLSIRSRNRVAAQGLSDLFGQPLQKAREAVEGMRSQNAIPEGAAGAVLDNLNIIHYYAEIFSDAGHEDVARRRRSWTEGTKKNGNNRKKALALYVEEAFLNPDDKPARQFRRFYRDFQAWDKQLGAVMDRLSGASEALSDVAQSGGREAKRADREVLVSVLEQDLNRDPARRGPETSRRMQGARLAVDDSNLSPSGRLGSGLVLTAAETSAIAALKFQTHTRSSKALSSIFLTAGLNFGQEIQVTYRMMNEDGTVDPEFFSFDVLGLMENSEKLKRGSKIVIYVESKRFKEEITGMMERYLANAASLYQSESFLGGPARGLVKPLEQLNNKFVLELSAAGVDLKPYQVPSYYEYWSRRADLLEDPENQAGVQEAKQTDRALTATALPVQNLRAIRDTKLNPGGNRDGLSIMSPKFAEIASVASGDLAMTNSGMRFLANGARFASLVADAHALEVMPETEWTGLLDQLAAFSDDLDHGSKAGEDIFSLTIKSDLKGKEEELLTFVSFAKGKDQSVRIRFEGIDHQGRRFLAKEEIVSKERIDRARAAARALLQRESSAKITELIRSQANFKDIELENEFKRITLLAERVDSLVTLDTPMILTLKNYPLKDRTRFNKAREKFTTDHPGAYVELVDENNRVVESEVPEALKGSLPRMVISLPTEANAEWVRSKGYSILPIGVDGSARDSYPFYAHYAVMALGRAIMNLKLDPNGKLAESALLLVQLHEALLPLERRRSFDARNAGRFYELMKNPRLAPDVGSLVSTLQKASLWPIRMLNWTELKRILDLSRETDRFV
ncbi:MAG: hypothetical protein HYT89_07550 [Candidatus Omnitrophica bacterium]|nr:hypothetical protein [Candidatus Omnitrophota bacterium]